MRLRESSVVCTHHMRDASLNQRERDGTSLDPTDELCRTTDPQRNACELSLT